MSLSLNFVVLSIFALGCVAAMTEYEMQKLFKDSWDGNMFRDSNNKVSERCKEVWKKMNSDKTMKSCNSIGGSTNYHGAVNLDLLIEDSKVENVPLYKCELQELRYVFKTKPKEAPQETSDLFFISQQKTKKKGNEFVLEESSDGVMKIKAVV